MRCRFIAPEIRVELVTGGGQARTFTRQFDCFIQNSDGIPICGEIDGAADGTPGFDGGYFRIEAFTGGVGIAIEAQGISTKGPADAGAVELVVLPF